MKITTVKELDILRNALAAIGVPERAENPPVLDAVCAPLAETIE